jgi:hypothetical protein
VSLRCCAHAGAKLADNATCGARCAAFPGCLPVFPPEVAAEVLAWRVAGEWAEVDAEAVADVLEQLHAAITEGLNRKGG